MDVCLSILIAPEDDQIISEILTFYGRKVFFKPRVAQELERF